MNISDANIGDILDINWLIVTKHSIDTIYQTTTIYGIFNTKTNATLDRVFIESKYISRKLGNTEINGIGPYGYDYSFSLSNEKPNDLSILIGLPVVVLSKYYPVFSTESYEDLVDYDIIKHTYKNIIITEKGTIISMTDFLDKISYGNKECMVEDIKKAIYSRGCLFLDIRLSRYFLKPFSEFKSLSNIEVSTPHIELDRDLNRLVKNYNAYMEFHKIRSKILNKNNYKFLDMPLLFTSDDIQRRQNESNT